MLGEYDGNTSETPTSGGAKTLMSGDMDGGSGGGGGGGGGGCDLGDIGEFDVGIASEAPTSTASSVSLVASSFPSDMTRMTGVTVMTEYGAVPLKLFVSAGTRS